MAKDGVNLLRKKQQAAQEKFHARVNRMGLRDMRVAHYESELGSLRFGVGIGADGLIHGIIKWFYPDLDPEGKTFHWSWTYDGAPGDTFEQAHDEIKAFAELYARKVLSGGIKG